MGQGRLRTSLAKAVAITCAMLGASGAALSADFGSRAPRRPSP